MKCLRCKKTIDDGDLFCGFCGINQLKFSKYLEKVSKKIHKQMDSEYNKKVQDAQKKLKLLEDGKKKEIKRITDSRWTVLNAQMRYNKTEGKIIIGNEIYNFNDIKSAEIIKNDSCRVETTITGETKRNISVSKAAVGGAFFGKPGAIAGGTMGDTKLNGKSVSISIPTCTYIGVKIDIKGFITEVPILTSTIDQNSQIFINKLAEAQNIVNKLRTMSTYQVPKKWLKPEEEKTVLDFDPKIEKAKEELKKILDDKPTYDIPSSYFE